jgi:hypothetical protein
MEVNRTYVWSPLHKNHKFERAGKYHIPDMGILFLNKCEICGNVVVKIERPSNKKIRVGGLFRK